MQHSVRLISAGRPCITMCQSAGEEHTESSETERKEQEESGRVSQRFRQANTHRTKITDSELFFFFFVFFMPYTCTFRFAVSVNVVP